MFAQSPIVWDEFQMIPGLISCAKGCIIRDKTTCMCITEEYALNSEMFLQSVHCSTCLTEIAGLIQKVVEDGSYYSNYTCTVRTCTYVS